MEAMDSSTVVNEYAAALESGTTRQRFLQVVQELAAVETTSITPDEASLSQFLTLYCNAVAELFAASTVAIWFDAGDQGSVQRRVDVGWKHLRLTTQTYRAHDHLVAHAIARAEAFVVHPFSAPSSRAEVSNPTDSFLLFAPVTYEGRNVAVLEIALGPKPLRRPHATLIRSYLPWLRWLSRILGHGMRRCFDAEQPLFSALATLQQASSDVDALQAQIVGTIQCSLQSLAGKKFGSLAANQQVAKQVHALLDSKGLRVKCPECGAAAILRCQNSGNSKTGAFVYDHYLDRGRTFHGGPSSFPLLELVAKPPRRKS